MSIADLRKEMARRQRNGQTLLRKRGRLLSKLQQLDARIAELGISARGGPRDMTPGRKRTRNEMNLVGSLSKLLNGKTMSVTDVSEAVQKAGYQTSSPNFRTIVNQALIASGKFKRVGRGQYTAK
jgi:hypothetical protein